MLQVGGSACSVVTREAQQKPGAGSSCEAPTWPRLGGDQQEACVLKAGAWRGAPQLAQPQVHARLQAGRQAGKQ
jgi:hypothetical protein